MKALQIELIQLVAYSVCIKVQILTLDKYSCILPEMSDDKMFVAKSLGSSFSRGFFSKSELVSSSVQISLFPKRAEKKIKLEALLSC